MAVRSSLCEKPESSVDTLKEHRASAQNVFLLLFFFFPRSRYSGLRNLRPSNGLICIQLHGPRSDTTEINLRRSELIGRDYSGYVDVDELCSTACVVPDRNSRLLSKLLHTMPANGPEQNFYTYRVRIVTLKACA